MKKWIGAVLALLFFVGLLAFLLPILGWQKQLDQESAEYKVLSSAVQLPQASEPPVVTPSEADSSVLNDLISSLDGDVLSEDIPVSSAPARISSIDLEACKAQNSDFAAWLSIPNTPVNYPVVFTYDTAYYLKHSFTGSTSSLGTLFATGDTRFSRPSRNIAIYGHNIHSKPTVMFSPLLSYKKAAFYQAHRTIHLDTLNGAYLPRRLQLEERPDGYAGQHPEPLRVRENGSPPQTAFRRSFRSVRRQGDVHSRAGFR